MRSCVGALVLVNHIIGIMIESFVHQVNALVSHHVILISIVVVNLSQIVAVVTLNILSVLLVPLESHALVELHLIVVFIV